MAIIREPVTRKRKPQPKVSKFTTPDSNAIEGKAWTLQSSSFLLWRGSKTDWWSL